MENVIANRIRERRLQLGLSQGQLAIKLKINKGTVSAWERGVSEPKIISALSLAKAFGTTVEELFSP